MSRVVDETQFYTRRQADTRFVKSPIHLSDLIEGGLDGDIIEPGTLPGDALEHGAITAELIAEKAIEIRHLVDGITFLVVIPADQELPVLPDAAYPQGTVLFWKRDNKLYRSTGATWEFKVPVADLEGVLTPEQIADASLMVAKFAEGLSPLRIVDALPTLPDANFPKGSLIFLKANGKTYQNLDDAHWSALVSAANLQGVLTADQIGDGIIGTAKLASEIKTIQVIEANVDPLPDLSNPTNRLKYPQGTVVIWKKDNKLYRSTGTAWTAAVPVADLSGKITADQITDASLTWTKFASTVRPVEIVSTLPDLTLRANQDHFPAGAVVYLTTDSKLYRSLGASWTSSIAAADVTGAITAEQIADEAVGFAQLAKTIHPVLTLSGALPDMNLPEVRAQYPAGTVVYRTDDTLLYRSTGTSWTKDTPASTVTGQLIASQIQDASLTTAKFAAGIRPVAIVAALPSFSDPSYVEGDVVYVKADGKLYRKTATKWDRSAAATDITGSLSGDQITDASLQIAKFASGLRPVQLVGSLPSPADPNYPVGSVLFNSADGKLYRKTASGWSSATAAADIAGTINENQISDGAISIAKLASGIKPVQVVDSLPTFDQATYPQGTIVYNKADGLLWSSTGSAWAKVAADAGVADGAITLTKFASDIRPVQIFSDPSLPQWNFDLIRYPVGSIIYWTVDGRLYRNNGTAWSAEVPAAAISGQIGATQISDSAVTTPKLAAGSVDTTRLAAGAVTANNLSAGAVVAGTIAAGAISTSELASDAITADKIAADSISARNIRAGAITADKLAANSVTAGTIAAGAISTSELSADAVKAQNIAADAITARAIKAGEIVAGKLAANSVVAGDLAVNAVTAGTILAGAISTSELAADAVQAQNISADAITARHIRAGEVTADALAVNSVTALAIAAGAVTADALAVGAVVAGTIAAGAIGTTELAAGAVKADNIAAGAITVDKLAVNSVTAAAIAAGAITSEKLSAGSVTAGVIAAGAISTTQLAADAVVAVNLAADAVLARNIKAGEITAGKLDVGAVQADNLAAGSVIAGKIAAGAISATEIAGDAITADKLAANAVFARNIASDQIDTDHLRAAAVDSNILAANSVTADHLVANSITTAVIAAGAISTDELAADAVRAQNIAADSIIARHIQTGTITGDRIAANTIDGAKLTADSISARELAADAVTAGTIQAGAIGTWELASDAITADKLAVNCILARNIQGGTITGDKIAANTIQAGNLVAGTITGNEIAGDTITGGNIKAGTIGADSLKAGAISADKLVVGNFDNLCEDPSFEKTGPDCPTGKGAWGYDGNGAVVANVSGRSGSWCARKPGSAVNGGASALYNRLFFDVREGEQYRFEGYFKCDAGTNGAAIVMLQYYRSDGSFVANSTGSASTSGAFPSVWTLYGASDTVPAGASKARLLVYFQATAGTWYADDVACRSMVTSTVLANAAILTAHIANLQVDTLQLAEGAVISGKIKEISVGGGGGRPGLLTVFDANGSSTLGWIGKKTVGATTYQGGYFKELRVGGVDETNPNFISDSSGNLTVKGNIEVPGTGHITFSRDLYGNNYSVTVSSIASQLYGNLLAGICCKLTPPSGLASSVYLDNSGLRMTQNLTLYTEAALVKLDLNGLIFNPGAGNMGLSANGNLKCGTIDMSSGGNTGWSVNTQQGYGQTTTVTIGGVRLNFCDGWFVGIG